MRRLGLMLMMLLALSSSVFGAGFDIFYRGGNTAEISAGSTHASLGAAIQYAHDLGWSRITLPRSQKDVNGDIVPTEIGTAVTLSEDNVSVVGHPDTILTNASGAVGFFTISGNNCSVYGIQLEHAFVEDQSGIVVSGKSVGILGVTLYCDEANGSSANPLSFIKAADGSSNVVIQDSTFHPNDGVRCIWNDSGDNLLVSNNRFVPKTGEANRDCWRVIDIEGGYRARILRNTIANLGTSGTPLDEVIRQWEEVDNAALERHDEVKGNLIESCASRHYIHILGRKSLYITDNRFYGANTTVMSTNNFTDRWDSTLFIENQNGTVSSPAPGGNPEFSAHVYIGENEFDANGSGSASEIYIRHLVKGEVRNNRFAHQAAKQCVLIEADHSSNIAVTGNYFDGFYPTDTDHVMPIKIVQRLAEDEAGEVAGSTATPLYTQVEGITIAGNVADGWKLGQAPATGVGTFPPTLGVRGFYAWTGLHAFSEQLSATTISFVASGNKIQDSGSGFGNIKAGDYIMVLGSTKARNNGLRAVTVAASGELTVNNPSAENNCDPTFNSGNGWTLEDESAGATVKVYVYKRQDENATIGENLPVNTNVHWRGL